MKKLTSAKIDFTSLYARCINEWPKRLDLEKLGNSGLGKLYRKISEPYIKSYDEILMTGMHDAIHILLHRVSASCKAIDINQLRIDVVKAIFEERLTPTTPNGSDLGWSVDDRLLVKKYYAATKKLKLDVKSKT